MFDSAVVGEVDDDLDSNIDNHWESSAIDSYAKSVARSVKPKNYSCNRSKFQEARVVQSLPPTTNDMAVLAHCMDSSRTS